MSDNTKTSAFEKDIQDAETRISEIFQEVNQIQAKVQDARNKLEILGLQNDKLGNIESLSQKEKDAIERDIEKERSNVQSDLQGWQQEIQNLQKHLNEANALKDFAERATRVLSGLEGKGDNDE